MRPVHARPRRPVITGPVLDGIDEAICLAIADLDAGTNEDQRDPTFRERRRVIERAREWAGAYRRWQEWRRPIEDEREPATSPGAT